MRLRRRVSVDLTVPRYPTPLATSQEEPVYWLPLALLRKRRLRRLDLRDACGNALPVLTREQDGAVAAGVLIAAARQRATLHGSAAMGDRNVVPDSVRDDLWRIANESAAEAQRVWERLGRSGPTDSPHERAWRDFLIEDEQFMTLASDFARNFILMTEVQAYPDDRLILKFSYEEPRREPEWRLRRRVRESVSALRTALRELAATLPSGEGGRGALGVVQAYCSTRRTDPHGIDTGTRDPQHGVQIVANAEGRAHVTVSDYRGIGAMLIPAGDYTVEAIPPLGVVAVAPTTHAVTVAPGRHRLLHFEHRRIASLTLRPSVRDLADTETLTYRFLRAIGWYPERITILTPSVGHARSFHLEVVSPEELKLTRAKLTAREAYWKPPEASSGRGRGSGRRAAAGSRGRSAAPPAKRTDGEYGAMQRAHLHLSDAGQQFAGSCVVCVRPLVSTVVPTATGAALISATLLLIMALRLDGVGANAGPIATLLLVVPGGLSAYVARQRESPLATKMVLGLRIMALLSGMASLVAAGIVVLARDWTINPKNHTVGAGALWDGAGTALYVLSGFVFVVFLLLAGAWYFTARMPESRREIRLATFVRNLA